VLVGTHEALNIWSSNRRRSVLHLSDDSTALDVEPAITPGGRALRISESEAPEVLRREIFGQLPVGESAQRRFKAVEGAASVLTVERPRPGLDVLRQLAQHCLKVHSTLRMSRLQATDLPLDVVESG